MSVTGLSEAGCECGLWRGLDEELTVTGPALALGGPAFWYSSSENQTKIRKFRTSFHRFTSKSFEGHSTRCSRRRQTSPPVPPPGESTRVSQ